MSLKPSTAKLFSRPKKLAYKGRHLCPQCQNELGRTISPTTPPEVEQRQNHLRQLFQAKRKRLNAFKAKAVKEYYARKGLGKPSRLALKREPMIQSPLPLSYRPQPKQHSLFEIAPPDTLAYERNSGRIPVRPAHHYTGNIERWQKIWPGEVWSLRGDSTKLAEVIRGAGIVISSLPFGGVLSDHPSESIVKGGLKMGQSSMGDGYGQSPNQLGAMTIGSPPFTSSAGSDDPDKRGGLLSSDPRRKGDKNLTGSYGESEGQIGVMAVGSPPFGEGTAHDYRPGRDTKEYNDKYKFTRHNSNKGDYGTTEGQLGILSVGSPPFAQAQTGGGIVNDTNDKRNSSPSKVGGYQGDMQGTSPGQLSALSLGSPPWAGNSGGQTDAARNGIDPGIFDRHQGGMRGGTGSGEGNLDSLPMVSLGSPPYLETHVGRDIRVDKSKWGTGQDLANDSGDNYGTSPAQLGNAAPTTFWEASELIINQIDYIFSLHAPNSIMIWICKRFIKDGVVVDFSRQWADLCEYCGFELIEWIRAWQVSEVAVKMTLEGERESVTKGGVSFFRNLVNKKYKEDGREDMVIANEDILVLRRK